VDIRDGKIFTISEPQKTLDITELALKNHPEARGSIKLATCLEDRAGIIGSATFWGHPSTEDPETGQGERLAISYAYGAQAVEVAVDIETGIVKVLRIYTAFDNGKTINPQMCEAQMEGGAVMGLGCALYEGFIIDDKGVLQNPNFHDYKICSMGNVPSGNNMKVAFVELPHKEGPYGAKGVSEAAMCPTAPAIGNAIYNATGVRLKRIPMTPERILMAIKESK
jgi:CO/xanthine dehydrogenase Mo-binding subunit